LSKEFGVSAALRGVDLAINAGELVGLLGPSGSGKTTLLRLIAGLETPTGGQIFFNGEDAARKSVQERRIGFVFQSYALFRHMTVADNIAYGLTIRPRRMRPHKAEIKRRVGELLELMQLGGFGKRFPEQLSGGQRQRVALARALAVKPRLLLLDEPFGALDARVRKDLRRWLREIHDKTGHTTIFVTHDQDEALELSDRVAVLHNGQLEQFAAPREIYERPATAFVHGFIGDSNRLHVEVAGGRVRRGGAELGSAPNDAQPGAALLYFRPQHASVVSHEEAPLRGAIRSVRTVGGATRAEIALDEGGSIIDVALAPDHAATAGARTGVRLSSYRIFPASAAA
jgi:sulfate transport system ATP-binding protein